MGRHSLEQKPHFHSPRSSQGNPGSRPQAVYSTSASSSRDFETSGRNWRSSALVAFLFSSETPEACRRHANQITRKLLAQFVRNIRADVPVAWRRREGNGRPRGHCKEVLYRNT